jgi:RNA polymerase sigma-70 factor (ECF subfamily)
MTLVAAWAEVAPRLTRAGYRRSIDGEDVGQEAVLRVLQVLAHTVIDDPVRYLLRVARNLFVDAERARTRERALNDPTSDSARELDRYADPERTLVDKQRLERALSVIDDLPPRCRRAFRLHRFEGLTYAAIAREMEISPSMVEKHIAEAMLRLRSALVSDES